MTTWRSFWCISEDTQARHSNPTHYYFTQIAYVWRGEIGHIKTPIPNTIIKKCLQNRVPNSYEKINGTKIFENEVMEKLAVTLLFTSILKELAEDAIKRLMKKGLEWIHCCRDDAAAQHMSANRFHIWRENTWADKTKSDGFTGLQWDCLGCPSTVRRHCNSDFRLQYVDNTRVIIKHERSKSFQSALKCVSCRHPVHHWKRGSTNTTFSECPDLLRWQWRTFDKILKERNQHG